MKKTCSSLLTLLLLSVFPVCSHAAVIMTSFDGTQSTTSNSDLGNNQGKAVAFTMPVGTDYFVDSIDLRLFFADNNDLDNSTVSLSLWGNSGSNDPDSQLVDFTNPTFSAGSTATFSFVPSTTFTLEADTSYWLVLTNSATNNAEVSWRTTSSASFFSSSIGATAGAGGNTALFGSGSPDTWTGASSVINSFTVNATVVPEPASGALLLGGLSFLALRRRR
ncbi:MAG: PEP-CTERM sorting domain-containing protein [Verrucomicrobiota bacterium]